MTEIRIDPLSGHRTIVAGERSRRPGGAPGLPPEQRVAETIDPEHDPFAEGNEDRTPPELYALRRDGGAPNSPGWTVRVVRNLYPALAGGGAGSAPEHGVREARGRAPGADELFESRPASGAHEVIVNERREAGASLPHTHAQLYALDFVPAAVARERERFGAYATRTMGQNLLGDLVAEEVRRQERIVAIDAEAVLMAPYASRLPFQLMLAPRTPRARFEEQGPSGAALLHDGLCRLARYLGASPPLNLWVRTAPLGAEHFCWRIDVLPRLTHLAGLELSTDVNINIVAPEHAATLLREA